MPSRPSATAKVSVPPLEGVQRFPSQASALFSGRIGFRLVRRKMAPDADSAMSAISRVM
jgi:hypothetical protein